MHPSGKVVACGGLPPSHANLGHEPGKKPTHTTTDLQTRFKKVETRLSCVAAIHQSEKGRSTLSNPIWQ